MRELEPVSRSRVKRVRVTEYRCLVCGTWQEASRPALTCSPACRVALHRARQRGEIPPYANRAR